MSYSYPMLVIYTEYHPCQSTTAATPNYSRCPPGKAMTIASPRIDSPPPTPQLLQLNRQRYYLRDVSSTRGSASAWYSLPLKLSVAL